jgi:hypothetical protein
MATDQKLIYPPCADHFHTQRVKQHNSAGYMWIKSCFIVTNEKQGNDIAKSFLIVNKDKTLTANSAKHHRISM